MLGILIPFYNQMELVALCGDNTTANLVVPRENERMMFYLKCNNQV